MSRKAIAGTFTTGKLITEKKGGKATVAIVGAGSFGGFLAVALAAAGFTITEIVARDLSRSRKRARSLAAKVGAHAVTARSAALDATVLWFCVPDGEIRDAASDLADRLSTRGLARP